MNAMKKLDREMKNVTLLANKIGHSLFVVVNQLVFITKLLSHIIYYENYNL